MTVMKALRLLWSPIATLLLVAASIGAVALAQVSAPFTVTVTPSSGGGGLPSKVIGEWFWAYSPGPSIATVQANAPAANLLSHATMFIGGGGGGNVHTDFGMYSGASAMKADIDAWKAAGKIFVGMIGGGGDSTVIGNSSHVTQFMNAAIPIIDQLGLQGVDFDLENTPDANSVASIITQLKSHYGSSFIIVMSPRPFEMGSGGIYRSIIQIAGINNIDLVQPQYYALNGDSLAAQQSYMDTNLNDAINGGIVPADKMSIGSSNPDDNESLSTAIQTYTHYKGVYPTLRGSQFWHTWAEQVSHNWQWAAQMATAP